MFVCLCFGFVMCWMIVIWCVWNVVGVFFYFYFCGFECGWLVLIVIDYYLILFWVYDVKNEICVGL